MNGSAVTVLNCIDGRTQMPVINWLKENFCVDYVDSITQAGMDKVLSQGNWIEIEILKKNVLVSVTDHHSKLVAIVGHYDCAANPVSEFQHFKDIIASINVVKTWGLPVNIVGLWVDEFWSVHVVEKEVAIA
ncbi:carbonic anhydrase [Clostridium sp.]|uniref:carbonic anhydrase n=1 Tax=Clostridium sp. TaxID=1506 RepID=UPI001A53D312|nr:carbonic anhydrase [Clostridium sp.]MBK5240022.1 hypothetical protein [Clostridium sp.]